MRNMIAAFFKLESAAGALLAVTAALAISLANTALSPSIDRLFGLPLAIGVGQFALRKPLLLWINDGLMAIFFLLVGLELKREVLERELSVGLFIPLTGGSDEPDEQPLRRLEHALHPWVAYAILPIFAFANAGVSLAGMSLADGFRPVPLGIAGGLFLGKLVGVFGVSAVLVAAGLARMPAGGTWLELFGVSACAGIGFTMSLFIGTLAFEDPAFATPLRLGVLVGSLLSAAAGYAALRSAAGPVD